MKCPNCDFENPETSAACAKCATPLPHAEKTSGDKTITLPGPPEEDSRLRTFAGRYEIIEQLGQGGMETIFRVFDQKTQEDIAIKILNPEVYK